MTLPKKENKINDMTKSNQVPQKKKKKKKTQLAFFRVLIDFAHDQ